MTKEEFDDLVQRLKSGDNSALAYLQVFQVGCIRAVMRKSGGLCDADNAYDLFVDGILDFRKNVLRDAVEYQNIEAYLKRICINKWLAMYRDRSRKRQAEPALEATLYPVALEPDAITEAEDAHARQLRIVEQAMQQISTQCRDILNMTIADELSMNEIATRLNFASADVAKTTKSRCFKKLLELIRKNHLT